MAFDRDNLFDAPSPRGARNKDDEINGAGDHARTRARHALSAEILKPVQSIVRRIGVQAEKTARMAGRGIEFR